LRPARFARLQSASATRSGKITAARLSEVSAGPTSELLIPLVIIAFVGTLAWEFQVTLPLKRGVSRFGHPAAPGSVVA
jgi:hypothetical protein